MTDFYGANATLSTQDVPAQMIPPGEQFGDIHVAFDSYAFAAVIDTTDSLKMFKLPKGARILDAVLKCDDLGTTGLLNVGWEASDDAVEAADADGFFTAIDVKAAAKTYIMSQEEDNNAGMHKKFTAEVQVSIVPTEITTATSGDISLAIYYVIN